MIVTDFEKLKTLLTDFGIEFEIDSEPDGTQSIVCREGAAKVGGYCNFYAYFNFDIEGTFDVMGVVE